MENIQIDSGSGIKNSRRNSGIMQDPIPSSRQSFKVGKLNLVDLAGSERVRLTGATGRRLEESKKINQVKHFFYHTKLWIANIKLKKKVRESLLVTIFSI